MIGVLATLCILAVLAAQVAVVTRQREDRPASAEPATPPPTVAVAAAAAGANGTADPIDRDPMDRVVRVLRRNRWLRRTLSFTSASIMAVAIGLIGFPYFTNLYASQEQSRLDRQLASDEVRTDYAACVAGEPGCAIGEGDSLTRIIIPAIDVDVVVVEGTSQSALRAGAGHYRSTPLPCEAGNVGIAGHRTTYGRPFHNLDLLRAGDEITLETPVGRCTYLVGSADMVEGQRVVAPEEISVIADTPDSRLTLTTCHPKGSARERLIIQATMVASGPIS